jgi:replicative DNA helicase
MWPKPSHARKPSTGALRNGTSYAMRALYNHPHMADLLPPHSQEAEEAVLGSLLIDPEAILRVASFLVPEHFYVVKHQWVYEAMLQLHEKREPIDLLTVSSQLQAQNRLDEIGGEGYIAQLTNSVPTALNAEAYARAVEQNAIRRKMIAAASDVARLAYDQTQTIQSVIEKSEAAIFRVSEDHGENQMVPIRKAVSDFFERIEYLHEHKDEPLGIPTGFNDLDKLTGGLQRGDLVIVAARPGVGKCVTEDTELVDPTTGELHTIRELIQRRSSNLLTLGRNLKLISSAASQFIDDGIKPVFRVRTALGREIETTAAHPFLTMDGWKALGNLQVGTHVAVPRQLPVFGPDAAPEHEAKLLAYLIADGCLTGRNPQFTNTNALLRDDFASAAVTFAGVRVRVETSQGTRTPTVYVAGDRAFATAGRERFGQQLHRTLLRKRITQRDLAQAVGVTPGAVSTWIHGNSAPDRDHLSKASSALGVQAYELVDNGAASIGVRSQNALTVWLDQLGLWGRAAADKCTPTCVFRYDRERLALFLNRLFACDGSVYVSGGKAVVSYGTVSQQLARQVQHLLLRFGVLAKLRRRSVPYKGERRTAFELQVTHRESLLTFMQDIGALGKEAAITHARAHLLAKPANVNLDVIPADAWPIVEQAKGTRSWRSVNTALNLGPDGNLHVGQRGISRRRMAQFATLFGDARLSELAESDVYWDKIDSIEPAGMRQVYDLTVPDTHNFVANDMVVHNTSLMLNLAHNAAMRHRQRVAVFSLEMGNEQLVQRFVASETGIDSQRLRRGDLRDDEWGALTRVSMQMADMNMFLDDSPSLTPLDLRVKARRIYQEHGLDLIVVDYLQLMQGETSSGKGMDNRVQEISYISRALKQIARELKVPLIAGSQLSRLVEQRSDKRPMLSDLRESGSIEQDADIVMFIYRDEIYNPDTEFKNIAEVSVQKNRNGPTGKVSLFFDNRLTSFKNLAREKIEL